MFKEHAEELTETTYGEYTMNAIEQTLNKLGEVKKLAETVKNLAFSMDDEGTENALRWTKPRGRRCSTLRRR